MLKIIYSLLNPFKGLIAFLLVLIFFTAFFEVIGLALILPILDIALNEDSTSPLLKVLNHPLRLLNIKNNITDLSIVFIIMVVIKNITFILSNIYTSKIVFGIRKYWMSQINNYYLSVSYSELIKVKQGVLVNNLVLETQKAATGILKINEFIISTVMAISYCILLFTTNPRIAILSIILFIVIYFVTSFLGEKKIADFGRKELDLNQSTNALASESISAMRQIRTFSIEKKISNILSEYLTKLKTIGIKYEFIKSLPKSLIEIFLFISILGGIILLEKNNPSILKVYLPILSVFVITAQRLMGQVNKMINTKFSFDFYKPTFQLIDSLLDKEKRRKTKPKTINQKIINTINTDITFEDVSFSYEKEKIILNQISFVIKKKSMTAIYGVSGSGKSTIADLILGLYQPTKGSIIVNQNNLLRYNLSSWRNQIGFISQDNYLFHDSIIENIKVGKPNATMDDVIRSSKMAQAYDFINNLPDGYETQVGDRGLILSGGQKQRIAIARALIRDPELLIFDEATSALDKETENKLMEIIYGLSKNKTVLIITHKMDILKKVNNIYKIEGGKSVNVSTQDL